MSKSVRRQGSYCGGRKAQTWDGGRQERSLWGWRWNEGIDVYARMRAHGCVCVRMYVCIHISTCIHFLASSTGNAQ